MGLILDAIVAVVVVLCIIQGYKRGVIRTIFGIVSFLLAAALTFLLYVPFTDFVLDTPVGQDMHRGIYDSIDKSIVGQWGEDNVDNKTNEELIEGIGLPEFLRGDVYQQSGFLLRNTAHTVSDAVSSASANSLMRIFTAIALFLLLLLALWLLRLLLEVIFKMPMLRGINKYLGFATGLIKGLLFAYLLLGTVAVIGNMENMVWLKDTAESSVIFKFMYQNNLLFNIFAGRG